MSSPTMSAEGSEPASNVDDELILRKKRHAQEGDLINGLNLTAMMDVLTILLVFLLKQYASAPENITLNDDLRPPPSTAPSNIVPAVSVLVSKSTIMVDQKTVLRVEGGKIVGAGDESPSYLPLATALSSRVETIKAIAARGGSPFDGNLMIIADEDAPYDLISNVLYQAGKAQFTSYRLVVRRR